jgi:catechol 2,3-dioxygenase-like lactoylglutathione lyase family enzyme
MDNLKGASPVCFILVADMAASRPFYTEVLGLTETGADQYAIGYDLGGTPLRLTEVHGHLPHPHTVLGWQVDDIVASVRALTARGVAFQIYDGFGQDSDGIWTAPDGHAKIAWFADPEGNNLSLTEFGG